MHALYRCKEHTESLVTQLSEWFGLGHLWDEYGIVGELVVCNVVLQLSLLLYLRICWPALYEPLPSCRYPRIASIGPFAPNH